MVEEETVKARIPRELWERVKAHTNDADAFVLEAVKESLKKA